MTVHSSWRRPLRLALALIALCSIAVAWKRGWQPDRVVPPLLTVAPRDIVGIRVRMGTHRLDAVRARAAWRIVYPPTPRPDAPAAVAALVESVTSLVPVDVFERQDVDRRQLGVEPGRARIELDTHDGPDTVVVVLGDHVPTGGSVYAAVSSDPRIFLLGALIMSEIEAAFFHSLPGDADDGASAPPDGSRSSMSPPGDVSPVPASRRAFGTASFRCFTSLSRDGAKSPRTVALPFDVRLAPAGRSRRRAAPRCLVLVEPALAQSRSAAAMRFNCVASGV